jgi:hypothetical protein
MIVCNKHDDPLYHENDGDGCPACAEWSDLVSEWRPMPETGSTWPTTDDEYDQLNVETHASRDFDVPTYLLTDNHPRKGKIR